MANMPYVRFENTLGDLKDCYEHLDDELEGSEEKAREDLISLCIQIADEYSDADEDLDEDEYP